MDPNILNTLQELTGKLPESRLILKLHNHFLHGRHENTPETRKIVGAMASRLVREVMSFCFNQEVITDEKGLQIAMRRFIAVAWLLQSEMLIGPDGNPMTLNQLSKLPQLDCTRCCLSLLAQKFGRRFNFHARVQKRQDGKINYAKSAKRGWEKRRARERSGSSGYNTPPS